MSISPIVLREIGTGEGDNRTPLRKNSVNPPLVSTVSEEARQGIRGGGGLPSLGSLVFQDNFDGQPDYTSAMHSTDRTQIAGTHTVPNGWFAIRQDPEWSPSVGYPEGRESIEILASNSDKARGGTGKSYVSWRDSNPEPTFRWNSDSILCWYDAEGMDEFYCEFYLLFSPDWTPDGGNSKIFRAFHWNGSGDIFGFGSDKNSAPVFFWNYSGSPTNARNRHTYRSGPVPHQYLMNDPPPSYLPRTGNTSYNFDGDIRNFKNHPTEDELNNVTGPIDFVTGLPVEGLVSHEGMWSDWRKMAFYLKMNSAPGARDGILMQWMDDHLIFKNNWMPWATSQASYMPKWNSIAIGGNDYFKTYPAEDRRQEWYSIDDFKIYDGLPEDKL